MNKMDCDIMEDLIPLYVEDMLSESSHKLVEEHLITCAGCARKAAELRKNVSIPTDVNIGPMNQVAKRIKKARVLFSGLTGFIVLFLLTLAIIHITSPIMLNYSEDIINIHPDDEGNVYMKLDACVAGYSFFKEPGKQGVYSVTCWNTLWNKYFHSEEVRWIEVQSKADQQIKAIYYYPNGQEPDALIYNNKYMATYIVTYSLPRLTLNYYFLIALFLFFVGMVCYLILRRSKSSKIVWRKIIVRITLLPLSYILSHILVLWGKDDIYNTSYYFSAIMFLCVVIYITVYAILTKVERKRCIDNL